jgi:hypothetical protein
MKTPYGLKQAPREWNAVLNTFLVTEGFKQSKRDPCIFTRGHGDDQILLGVFVDDIIVQL